MFPYSFTGEITRKNFNALMEKIPTEKDATPITMDFSECTIVGGRITYNGMTDMSIIPMSAKISCLILPKGLKETGSLAVYNNSITSITIPDSVTSIGRYTAWHCTGLGSINIPSSVKSMGKNVFEDCSERQRITVAWKEGNKPAGWSDDWASGCKAKIIYGGGK